MVEFSNTVGRFIKRGSRTPRSRIQKPARKPAAVQKTNAAGGYTPKQVRAWAAAHKVSVPSMGRIPRSVVDQYLAATED